VDRFVHWSVSLWVPPVVVVAVWAAFLARMPQLAWLPGWAYLLILAASLVTLLVSMVYAAVRWAEPWPWVALLVNLLGLAVNVFFILLGLAGVLS
jgi:hypothetical protein